MFVYYEGPCPFPRGDNYEIGKRCQPNIKIFSRTTGPISTKLCTMYPKVKGIQIYSNMKGPAFLQGGDNNKIAKIHRQI